MHGKLLLNVAKCNFGKVNLKATLFGNPWMQETRLQPWRFTGTLCDAYTHRPATAGRIKLGVAQDPHRGCL